MEEEVEKPLIQYFINSKGKAVNARSGAYVTPNVNSTRFRYQEVALTPAIKTRLKDKAVANRQRVKNDYVESFGAEYLREQNVGVYSEKAAPERRGQRRAVGTNRDSLLRAVSSAYAVAQGHKLSADNRRILDTMYAENIKTAIAGVPQQAGRQRWV